MKDHNQLKKDFKRLFEYNAYIVNDVMEPDFVKMTEDEELRDQQPQSTDQNQQPQTPEPTPQSTDQNQQPPAIQPTRLPPQSTPIQPVQPAPQPAPSVQQPAPVEQQNDEKFYYEKIMGDINSLLINTNNLNTRFETLLNKVDYLNTVVDEVREPSNEEKLLAMTKQSYPFNNSMLDVWGTRVNTTENNTIDSEIGEIEKVSDDNYQMRINIDDIPVNRDSNLSNLNKLY